jgi:hypothetical protein
MLFFSKPKQDFFSVDSVETNNNENNNSLTSPIQLVDMCGGKDGARGGLRLGTPLAVHDAAEDQRAGDGHGSGDGERLPSGTLVVAGGLRDYSAADIVRRRKLRCHFTFLALVNCVVAIAFYTSSQGPDGSLVEALAEDGGQGQPLPGAFSSVAHSTSHQARDQVQLIVAVSMTAGGMLACWLQSALGMGLYQVGLITNLIANMVYIPWAMYLFRYILELFLVVVAQFLRSAYSLPWFTVGSSPLAHV